VIPVELVPSVEASGRAVLPLGARDASVVARGEGFHVDGTFGPGDAWTVRGLPPGHDVRVTVKADVGTTRWVGEATVTPGTPVTIETKRVDR
jgi:hypothetical protein